MSIKAQLSTLINLAKVDGDFDGQEKLHILMLGRANGLSEAEIREIVENPVGLPDILSMSEEEKFSLLYNIVQLMKIDSEVYLSEIKYCEEVAEKLGFNKKVIATLSSRIYSDPSITADVDSLRAAVKKYMK